MLIGSQWVTNDGWVIIDWENSEERSVYIKDHERVFPNKLSFVRFMSSVMGKGSK